MLALAGIGVVIAAVIGGFTMAGGKLLVLMQPAEFVVICGAALGAILIANGPGVLKQLISQITALPKPGVTKKEYLDMLVMMYELLNVARKDGVMALESHIEHPGDSKIISKYASFAKNEGAVTFLSDTMRLIISGAGVEAHDLDDLMDVDLETHHHDQSKPSKLLQTCADGLPGLGIVAAVLGIVVTMRAIDGPAEQIGQHVAAALVGTFLGVLLAYGFVAPLSANLAGKAEEYQRYFLALKQVLLAFHKGSVPAIAVEFARRSLPHEVRPGFVELEEACRASKQPAMTA
ncbi:MAG TPA: flagellar motor stator protein MotA [Acidobacteriota bacterium]|nr:flagellar motor stator protein MotA [Acidobacteriota bacterium]